MPRELLDVKFISLVKKPANNEKLILKNVDKPTMFELVKSDDELKIAYGIVYSPDKEDLQGDTATAATIRKAAQIFMKEGRHQNIDTNHQFAKVQAYVAETWIVKASDSMFPNDEGAWAVGIKIEDEALWKGLQDGKFTGISLAGTASVDPVEKGEIHTLLEFFRKHFDKPEKEMDEKEVLKAIEEANKKFQEQFKGKITTDVVKDVVEKITPMFEDLKKSLKPDDKDGDDKDGDGKEDKTTEVVTKADLTVAMDKIKELEVQLNKKGAGESGINNGNGSFM